MIQGAKTGNELLDALDRKGRTGIGQALVQVDMAFGQTIYEAGAGITQIFFPTGCVFSLMATVPGHAAVEVGMIGREGVLGVQPALGVLRAGLGAVVQGEGKALRLPTRTFKKLIALHRGIGQVLLPFADAFTIQVSQTAACNRFHSVGMRLARWLAMMSDRLGSDRFVLTQEYLGAMLGARRAGVSVAAACLQRAGLIEYSRGRIHILDATGLRRAACSCYVDSR